MKQFAPSDDLAPFVQRFEVVETAAGMTRMLLPETGLIIGFRYAGGSALVDGSAQRPLPERVLTGLRSAARRMRSEPGSGIVLAKLRPGAAGRFFREPLHDLFGESVALDTLLATRELDRTARAVERARNDGERVAAVENFLRNIAREWQPDPTVQGAVEAIEASAGAVRVGELAAAAGLSRDAFEKRFRRMVGSSPKQYASIVRLLGAVGSYDSGRSLTELSFAAGYCDQSHFIRQFRRVTGQSPRAFFRSGEYCSSRRASLRESWASYGAAK